MISTKSITLTSAAVMAAFTLAACGGSSEPAQTVTETETTTATSTVTETASGIDFTDSDQYHEESTEEPAPTTTEAPEPESTVDEDIAAVSLEITWNDMTYSEQDDLCFGWEMWPEDSLDVFMEGVGEDFADRQQVKDFFDAKCEDYS